MRRDAINLKIKFQALLSLQFYFTLTLQQQEGEVKSVAAEVEINEPRSICTHYVTICIHLPGEDLRLMQFISSTCSRFYALTILVVITALLMMIVLPD